MYKQSMSSPQPPILESPEDELSDSKSNNIATNPSNTEPSDAEVPNVGSQSTEEKEIEATSNITQNAEVPLVPDPTTIADLPANALPQMIEYNDEDKGLASPGPLPTLSNKEDPVELEALEQLDSFYLDKDDSRRRTVFELRLIDGPLVLSAIDANPCCFCSGSNAPSNTRFLFDSFGPIIQTLEDNTGCFQRRSVEVCGPPYNLIGYVNNNTSWRAFELLVTGRDERPIYAVRQDRSKTLFAGNDYVIMRHASNEKVGAIFRRSDFGYRTGYTTYIPADAPAREKALLVAAVFFLDTVVGEGHSGGLGLFCC